MRIRKCRFLGRFLGLAFSIDPFRTSQGKYIHVGQIDQIDHELEYLDPNLPLSDVVQDL